MVAQISNTMSEDEMIATLQKQGRYQFLFFIIFPLGILGQSLILYVSKSEGIAIEVVIGLWLLIYAVLNIWLISFSIKLNREIGKIPSEFIRTNPKLKEMRTRQNWLPVFGIFCTTSPLLNMYVKDNAHMPLYILIQALLAVAIVSYALVSNGYRAAKETNDDEFIVNRARYGNFWGFYIAIFLMVAFQILLWNIPGIYEGIVQKFANRAPDMLVAVCLTIMLLGWGAGKFIGWDRFR